RPRNASSLPSSERNMNANKNVSFGSKRSEDWRKQQRSSFNGGRGLLMLKMMPAVALFLPSGFLLQES
ncbi:hypothetical protein BG000_007190, partial [Podila horticola]